MDARRGYRSRTALCTRIHSLHAQRRRERERGSVEAGRRGGGGCRRRGSREERVRALGRRRCTFPSSLPVQLYLHGVTCPINREEQRWYSPVDGLRIRCRLSLPLLFPMLLLHVPVVYARGEEVLCMYIIYIYIYSFANYRRAMPTQFNLNFDARGGCLAGGSEIRNAHAHPPLNRPKLMRVIS